MDAGGRATHGAVAEDGVRAVAVKQRENRAQMPGYPHAGGESQIVVPRRGDLTVGSRAEDTWEIWKKGFYTDYTFILFALLAAWRALA